MNWDTSIEIQIQVPMNWDTNPGANELRYKSRSQWITNQIQVPSNVSVLCVMIPPILPRDSQNRDWGKNKPLEFESMVIKTAYANTYSDHKYIVSAENVCGEWSNVLYK